MPALKSRWINQFHHLEAQSKFHEAFRQFLITDPTFKNLSCYQEVNVQDLCPDYLYRNHHFDWYIEQLGRIVELHGAQHYTPTRFGGEQGYDDLVRSFRRGQFRDGTKQAAAVESGFTYTIIPYTEQKLISYEYMIRLIEQGD